MQDTMRFQGHIPAASEREDADQRLLANVRPSDWQNPKADGRYNLVVIGGGSAGLVAAAGAAGLGARVALVERHLLGGDCLNVGCVPSKAIIRSAKAAGEVARAGQFGITAREVKVDFAAIMERMREVRADLSDYDSVYRFRKLGVDVYLGDGRFSGPDTVEVAGQTLHFSKAVIATGSRPGVPPIPGLEEAGYLTNETVWNLTALPQRLAVIGAGPIGAELAQSFHRFGSQVTVFDILPRMLGREDADAAEIIRQVFTSEGIEVQLGVQIKGAHVDGGAKRIDFEADGATRTVTVDEILVAAGRKPNIETLNLEAAGIGYTKQGIEVDDTLHTANPRVYAAGDVALKYQFTHTADATARLVLQNALFPGPKKKVSALTIPWATYTDPEVAHVGLYDWEAEEAGIPVETIVHQLTETDRGRADGTQYGFVKIHIKKGTDRILGATIVAPHAGELISEVTVAMAGGVGLKQLSTIIHPYPTEAEAIKKAADAYNRSRLTPTIQRLFGWWFRWSR